MSFRASAQELFFTGSGQPMCFPTDEELVDAIRHELALGLGRDALDTEIANACLHNAALAVRQLLLKGSISPSTSTDKD